MKKITLFRAHFLACIAGAIAGMVTAQCFMGMHLAPLRMLMGILFAPILTPVIVVVVPVTAVIRRSAPQPYFIATAITYVVVLGLLLVLRNRKREL